MKRQQDWSLGMFPRVSGAYANAKVRIAASAVLILVGKQEANAFAASYTITDLSPPDGSASLGLGINSNGQITGWTNKPYAQHAYLYSGGSMQDLGTLGGPASVGKSINASGEIAGYSLTTGTGTSHAFLYSNGAMTDLGTLGGSTSYGYGINDAGQVTGCATTPGDSNQFAFRFSNGVMTSIGTLGGSDSTGYAINDSGQITGSANITGNTAGHAFIAEIDGTMRDLGTIGGAYIDSAGNGINDLGEIAGTCWTNPSQASYSQHAFLFANGTMVDLGTLGGLQSDGSAINNFGQVVGSSSLAGDLTYHAFLYSNGTMTDLNDLVDPASGWILADATSINDLGQITGVGIDPLRETHAFLLTPTASPSIFTPEPATLLLTTLSLPLLLKRRR